MMYHIILQKKMKLVFYFIFLFPVMTMKAQKSNSFENPYQINLQNINGQFYLR